MARYGDNLVADQALLEVRGFRLWNRTTADLVSASVDVPDEQPSTVLGNGSASILGTAHRGLVVFDPTVGLPKFWNGSTWKGFAELTVSGGVYGDLPLESGKILEGNGSNLAAAVAKSSVSLSAWGLPTGTLDLNSHRIANVATPSSASDAATKDYVDSVATGLQVKTEALIGSNQALPSCVYDGGAGTLTASVNSTLTAALIDSTSGATLVAGAEGTGTRVLIKDQVTQIQNGIYRVSNLGSGATKWVLTRVADSDTNAELRAAYVLVTQGANGGVSYQQSTPSGSFDISAGTGNLVWSKFSQQTQYTAGNGISIGGNTVSWLVAGTTSWTTGDIFYGSSATAVGRITAPALTNAPLVSKGAGTKPDYLGYTLPATIAANQMYFASSSTAMSVVGGHAANRVLTTSAAGLPQWSNALPSVTINGANPVLDNQIIPISRGGTGLDHSASVSGATLYKSGGNWAATATAPVVGSVPMCTVAGTTVDMVDIFARANTWSNVNVFSESSGSAARTVQLATSFIPASGASASSAPLEWQGKSESGGTLYFHHYRARAFGQSFRFDQATGLTNGNPTTWTNWLLWDDASETLSILQGDSGARLQIGQVMLNGGPSSSTITFPAVGGTVAVRDLANTFLATQTVQAPVGNPYLDLMESVDTQPRLRFLSATNGGRIQFGPGGSSSVDTNLYRVAAGKLQLEGQLVIAPNPNGAGMWLDATALVTGSGLWRAGIIEMAYGGLQANASAFSNGAMVYKTSSGFAQIGGTNANQKIPISTGSAVNWSAYTVPSAVAVGDIVYGSAASTLSTLARPGTGTGTHVLGLSGGLPVWQATGATATTGVGPGGTAGIGRVWVTRYTGTSPANRYVNFTHSMGTRNVVAVGLRKTNSDDYASASGVGTSEAWATRWDVIDTNTVRVWFPTSPTASETYVVTVLAA